MHWHTHSLPRAELYVTVCLVHLLDHIYLEMDFERIYVSVPMTFAELLGPLSLPNLSVRAASFKGPAGLFFSTA